MYNTSSQSDGDLHLKKYPIIAAMQQNLIDNTSNLMDSDVALF
jgi:hypothetical protein